MSVNPIEHVEHELKAWTKSFEAIADGSKTFDLRKNDRNFKPEDTILMREFNPGTLYTGREMRVQITRIWDKEFVPSLPDSWVVLSIYPMTANFECVAAYEPKDFLRATV